MARLFTPFQQFFDDNGQPLSGGTLGFFLNGVLSEQLTTYSDPSLNNDNPNPVVLDGDGRLPFDIWGDGVYSVVLRSKTTSVSPNGVLINQLDTVGGDVGSRTAFSDWTSTIVYNIPAFVVGSDGLYYRSLSDNNLGNDPTLNPGANLFWEEFKFRGIWNSSITYNIGDVVQTPTGNVWKSLLEQAANDPESDNGTNWIPAIDGSKVPEIIALQNAVGNVTTVIAQTGGGELTISRINELQDADAGYTLPSAASVVTDEYLIISQSLPFVLNEPLVTVDGTDTISVSGSTDTDIIFDNFSSIDIRLTTDGVSDWRLTVI